MERNPYYDLGVKLAFQQAILSDAFLKNAGVWNAIKDLLKKAPPPKGSFKAWRKSEKARRLLLPRYATETSTYNKFRQHGSLAKHLRVA